MAVDGCFYHIPLYKRRYEVKHASRADRRDKAVEKGSWKEGQKELTDSWESLITIQ